jgi:RNA polymerase sigma-70 factor (ECF subfamily)
MVPHMSLLYNYAVRLTNNAEDAKDLIQDTYLKAYRFIDKYERGTNAKAWLFPILKNSFINNYRKNSRTPQQVEYTEVEDYVELMKSDCSDNHFESIFDNVMGDDVMRAMELNEDSDDHPFGY